MSTEIWATPLSDPYIEVSSLGRARRLRRPISYKDGRSGFLPPAMLRTPVGIQGYAVVSGGSKRHLLHRLMAEAFLAAPDDVYAYQTVNHKNGVKTDNRIENIEWVTHKTNNDHARDTGLCKQHGNNTNLTKFSEQLILALRKVHAKYQTSATDLAEMFGVSRTHVYEILNGTSRKRG